MTKHKQQNEMDRYMEPLQINAPKDRLAQKFTSYIPPLFCGTTNKVIQQFFVCLLILTLLCLSACEHLPVQTDTDVLVPGSSEEELLLRQFLEDASVPEAVREHLAKAIRGDVAEQKWIDNSTSPNGVLEWSVANAIFPYGNHSDPYVEHECFYNIGMFYYEGDADIDFAQDKTKAFAWFKLAADKGNYDGAIQAGDMVRYGDGVPADEQAAFALYSNAADMQYRREALQRLGDCYLEGIGTTPDEQKAFLNYFDSASMGYAPSLYKLSTIVPKEDVNMTALYKAASSQNYYDNYGDMAYGGLDGYSADSTKQDLINKLSDIWNDGNDPATLTVKKDIPSNQHFPKELVEELMKIPYTYSYHAFAEKYGVRPNKTYAAGSIPFAGDPEDEMIEMAQRYDRECYEYDYDGDGQNELGIYLHSGAGGSFMVDNLIVFKKNRDGLYEYYARGPSCALRDAMRIVQYKGKIYFIVNPFDDKNLAPHDMVVRTIGENGHEYDLEISCRNYIPQRVITHTEEAYLTGYDKLLTDVESDVQAAIDYTKMEMLLSPFIEIENKVEIDDEILNSIWDKFMDPHDEDAPSPENIFFSTDIDNDGIDEVIHKGYCINHSKYYDDYRWFQIYENSVTLKDGSQSIVKPEYDDTSFGLHSKGNLYDVLPVGKNVIQFWTEEYDGKIYCKTLQKNGLIYTLSIFVIQEGEAHRVSQSLFLDEPQGMEVSFSSHLSRSEN